MRPEANKYYNTWYIKFHNVLVLVLNMFLGIADLFALSCVNKLMRRTVPHMHRLVKLNWRPLLEPRLDCESQTCIDMNIVYMGMALAIRSGLDPGKNVRTMNGEYIGAWRNVEKVLAAVAPVISDGEYQHIKQILTQGCPFELIFEEQESSKLQMLRRGNKNFQSAS